MRSKEYIAETDGLTYIKEHGRCAITKKPLAGAALVFAVLLPKKAAWPLPVWNDYPLGSNAKAVAFILPPNDAVTLKEVTEATQCDGLSITFHPITFSKEEANETAVLQEV